MKSKTLLLTLFMLSSITALSQAPSIEWQKCFGGTNFERAQQVIQTSDGGYIIAGYSESNNGDVTGHHGNVGTADYWIVKINSSGDLQWEKSFGGSEWDEAHSIIQTNDGGYLIAGLSTSDNYDVTDHHWTFAGNSDCWIIKLDSSGSMLWSKSYGGLDNDWAFAMTQSNDGGFIIAGGSGSNDYDVSGNHGSDDYWVFKIDSAGNLLWQNSLGGSSNEIAYGITSTKDNGCAVAGWTWSTDGQVIGSYGQDYWIIKLDSMGTLQWQKPIGGLDPEEAYSIIQTLDGGYIVTGFTLSNDGDVSGNHGGYDYWVVKLDSAGNIQWQKCIGGSLDDNAQSIIQLTNGNYIVVGYAASSNGDLIGSHGGNDFWVVTLDSVGNILWQLPLGGIGGDLGWSIIETSDGSLVGAGQSNSNDDDVSGNHGGYDFWVVKLSYPTSITVQSKNKDITIFPNPSTGVFQIQNASSPIQTAEAFNLLGEKVFSTSNFNSQTFPQGVLRTNSIDLSNQPDGVYFLHLKTTEGMVVKKVVISK